jgi:hypothetical protein
VHELDDLARQRELQDRTEEREETVIELMNGPSRPSPQRRRTVVWIGLAFGTLMLALTLGVIAQQGLDILTLTTLVALVFLDAAMIGLLRYRGEDPMAQFDPPERPKSRRRSRRG